MNQKTNSSDLRHTGTKIGSAQPCRDNESPSFTGASASFLVKGKRIAIDSQGRIRLNDIHRAGGFSVNKMPSDWTALAVTQELVIKVCEKTTGKSGNLTKSDILSVLCTKRGAGGGTWVHLHLALAYAKYLSADLHYEVNEVFLRYKGGDATLADDVLQRSGPKANEWAGVRALGRSKRNRFTSVLHSHDVSAPKDFAIVTNAVYGGLFGKDAKTIRRDKGLTTKSGALRDKMSTDELVYVMASEQLASERIEDEDRRGMAECRSATLISSGNIRKAIEADRASRRKASG